MIKNINVIIIFFMISIFANSQELKEPKRDIYSIQISKIDGTALDLSEFRNRHILFVNVASRCGFTGQYKGLEELYRKYKDKLMVIGVPCNQFGNQEPGAPTQIMDFCERNYGVTFILTEKLEVKGVNQHELYRWLTSKEQNGLRNSSVKWNFQKYLVNEQGQLVDIFYSTTKPMSKSILKHL